jgi:hypothetical protein
MGIEKTSKSEQFAKAVELWRSGLSFAAIGHELGLSQSTVWAWMKKAAVTRPAKGQETLAPPPPEGVQDSQDGGKRSVSVTKAGIRTIADALEFAEVDLRVWKVERSKVNKWEVGTKDADGTVRTTPLWQVCVWLKAREQSELQLESIAEKTIAQMASHAPTMEQYRGLVLPATNSSGKMLELDIMDVHLGMLSWSQETGKDYDAEIAGSRYMQGLFSLVGLSEQVCARPEAILLPTGNDFLHIDTERGSTTGDTPVDVDTRATRVFELGKMLIVKAVDYLLTKTPVVVVPFVPGNHDRFSLLHLAQTIAAWYRNMSGRVIVDFSPRLRKYTRWGKCLLGHTHGSEEKRARLPMIMAHEEPEAWAGTVHRAWRLGHWHSAGSFLVPVGETIDGVWVEQSAALAPRDAWHTRKGFVGAPAQATATLWDKEKGPQTRFSVRMD